MKKNHAASVIPIAIAAAVVTFFLILIFSSESDYACITDVDYRAVVVDEPGSDGKILITERLTYDVHADSEGNLYWELWRDLPESYVDGLKVDYTVLSVKQILEDGTEILYEESPKLYWDDYDYVSENTTYGPGKWFHSKGPYDEDEEQYECLLFYIDGVYREKMVFEIQYEMHNAVLRYNDCSDLYISLFSGESIEYLKSYSAQILFPEKDMPKKGNYDVTTYGTNAESFTVNESTTSNPGYYTFSFSLDEKDLCFKPYNQFIEFDLVSYGDDKDIFSEYANENRYTSDNVLDEIKEDQASYASAPEKYRLAKQILLVLSCILSAAVFFSISFAQKKTKKQYTFYPIDDNYTDFKNLPGELDPVFATSLVFCKESTPSDDSGLYASLLLSLARKKCVELTDTPPDDVLIHVNACETQLTVCERHYYNLLVRHAGASAQITMKEFQERVASDYENTDHFLDKLENSVKTIGFNEGYFQALDYDKPKQDLHLYAGFLIAAGILLATIVNLICSQTRLDLVYGAFFILGAACIISGSILWQKAKNYILLTQKGEIEYRKWHSFYCFLRDDSSIHTRTDIDLTLMEKYLVYAAAFGLADKLNQTMDLRFPKAAADSIVYNNYCRSGHIYIHSRGFSNSVQTGVMASANASGGGGYGGGGRGGGGGGGGH